MPIIWDTCGRFVDPFLRSCVHKYFALLCHCLSDSPPFDPSPGSAVLVPLELDLMLEAILAHGCSYLLNEEMVYLDR